MWIHALDDDRRVKLWIDNQGAKCIIRKMTTKSQSILRELRVLQKWLDKFGISLSPHWLSSANNCFTGTLSRTWDPGDTRVRADVRREILNTDAHVGAPATALGLIGHWGSTPRLCGG